MCSEQNPHLSLILIFFAEDKKKKNHTERTYQILHAVLGANYVGLYRREVTLSITKSAGE